MIDILKKMLHEGLAEMEIKQKDLFGSGLEHKIFPSSDPNKLYKVGYCDSISLFVKAVNKGEEYFPKIYKMGTIKYKNEKVCWIMIEKLNTEKVKSDFDSLNNVFQEIGLLNLDDFSKVYSDISYIFRDLLVDDNNEFMGEITNKLKKYDVKNKTKYKDLFLKWVVFLYKVESIVTSVKMSLDLHGGNFGYDNAGNLKCLDI
jgi:hypothetical protein